jgi:hypothetical protein
LRKPWILILVGLLAIAFLTHSAVADKPTQVGKPTEENWPKIV